MRLSSSCSLYSSCSFRIPLFGRTVISTSCPNFAGRASWPECSRVSLNSCRGMWQIMAWAETAGGCQVLDEKIIRNFTGVLGSRMCIRIIHMKTENRKIFDEEYRVLAVESQRLTIQGVRSGEVLTIQTENPESPLTAAEYPPGQLIALSDPSNTLPN